MSRKTVHLEVSFVERRVKAGWPFGPGESRRSKRQSAGFFRNGDFSRCDSVKNSDLLWPSMACGRISWLVAGCRNVNVVGFPFRSLRRHDDIDHSGFYMDPALRDASSWLNSDSCQFHSKIWGSSLEWWTCAESEWRYWRGLWMYR